MSFPKGIIHLSDDNFNLIFGIVTIVEADRIKGISKVTGSCNQLDPRKIERKTLNRRIR